MYILYEVCIFVGEILAPTSKKKYSAIPPIIYVSIKLSINQKKNLFPDKINYKYIEENNKTMNWEGKLLERQPVSGNVICADAF